MHDAHRGLQLRIPRSCLDASPLAPKVAQRADAQATGTDERNEKEETHNTQRGGTPCVDTVRWFLSHELISHLVRARFCHVQGYCVLFFLSCSFIEEIDRQTSQLGVSLVTPPERTIGSSSAPGLKSTPTTRSWRTASSGLEGASGPLFCRAIHCSWDGLLRSSCGASTPPPVGGAPFGPGCLLSLLRSDAALSRRLLVGGGDLSFPSFGWCCLPPPPRVGGSFPPSSFGVVLLSSCLLWVVVLRSLKRKPQFSY